MAKAQPLELTQEQRDHLEVICRTRTIQAEELLDAISTSKYSISDLIKMVKGKKPDADED